MNVIFIDRLQTHSIDEIVKMVKKYNEFYL